MEKHGHPPSILHLAGITLADYVPVEDIFDEKVLEFAEKEERLPEPLPFDRIPARFTGLDDWPPSTNLRCWSCAFTFDNPPRFVPTYIRQGDDGKPVVGVEGSFCTFNCAARHIDTTYPPQAFPAKHWRMRDNLCTVYFFFTGRRVDHIEPAPARTELRAYGGGLSEEKFWERMRRLDPLHGLRDHRPGTIAPERARLPPLPGGPTMWSVSLAACAGVPPTPRPAEAGGLQPPAGEEAAALPGEDDAGGAPGAPGGGAAALCPGDEMARELEGGAPAAVDPLDLLLEELYGL